MRLHNLARAAALAGLLAALTTTDAQAQTSATGAGSAIAPFARVPGVPGTPALALGLDPRNGRVVYADGAGGRIARTFSGGEHWDAVQVAGIYESFRAIAVDPADSNIVIAFSTSESDDGASAGVYMSRNRGAHWQRLASQPAGALGKVGFGRGALFDASGSTILLADKRQGIFRSVDFGVTWTNPLPRSAGRTYVLVRDPNDPQSYWAGGVDADLAPAVFASHDGGQSWTKSAIPPDPSLYQPIVLALAVQPHSGRVVAGTNGFTPFGLSGDMWISDDGGAHWAQGTVTAQQWAAGNAIVFSSQSDSIAYAGGNGSLGLLRSVDGGLSWTQVLVADGSGFFSLALVPARSGHGDRLFGAGSGVIESSDDGGSTWARADGGLALLTVNEAAESGRASGELYVQNGLGGLLRSTDAAAHWLPIDPIPGAFSTADIAVDPIARSHPLYAVTFLNQAIGMSRSDDGGRHWSTLPAPLPSPLFQEMLSADPTRAGTAYLFVSSTAPLNSVLRTSDFGATWQQVPVGVAGDFAAVPGVLAPDPNRPGVVFAAMGSGLWKSADFGLSWNLVPQLPLGLAGIAGIAVTGGPSGAVYVVAGADDGTFSLQQSRDGGNTWSAATSAFGTSPYVLRTGGNALYAYQWLYDGCADPSVLQSLDGGSTWSLVDGNLESQFNPGDCITLAPTKHHFFISDPFGTWLGFVENLGRDGEATKAQWNRPGRATGLPSDDLQAPVAAGQSAWDARRVRDR